MPRLPLVAIALALVACTGAGTAELPPSEVRSGCELPERELAWMRNGYHPDRSGEIQHLPAPGTVVGKGLSHTPPAADTQRVPNFWYGPGVVPALGRIEGRATSADLAPTMAGLIDFEFPSPDGRSLGPVITGDARPRLVVMMVWDAAGRNVLAEHPDAWPNLREAIDEGVWFEDAVVGSAPSNTPAVHASFGTGAFPRTHGRVTSTFWLEGEYAESEAVGPADLLVPGLADLYAAETGNEARVGVVGSRGWHLGMLGQGSRWPGVDPPIAVLTDPETGAWGLEPRDARFFRFPAYVHEVEGLEELVRSVDLEDGSLDGEWLGEDVLRDPTELILTPAWTEHQTRVIEEVVRREGFGADAMPDLLFLNYKQIDLVGHRWGMHGPHAAAAVAATDRAFGELVRFLDGEVGEGRWALSITSDHGFVRSPDESGAFVIADGELALDVERAFDPEGEGIIVATHPTQTFVDVSKLEAAGHSLEDVADFIASYTKGQNVDEPSSLAEDERDDRLFPTVFLGSDLEDGACPGG